MRSSAAARVLQAQGFTNVVNLRGGVQAWRTENLPLVKEGGGKSKARGNQGMNDTAQPEITMYSTGWCPYCDRARGLLERKGVTFSEVKVDEDPASATSC